MLINRDVDARGVSVRRVYLQQGEIGAARLPCVFRTVLGSCVAVCLWDPESGIGGLNHVVLPRGGAARGDARYADAAIPLLIARLLALGARRLQAKLFGGAQVAPLGGGGTVGAANTRAALELLTEHAIELAARRTGGSQGIVLQFMSHTGEAQVRPIAHVRSAEAVAAVKAFWAVRASS